MISVPSLECVTPTVLTYNEEPNIGRTLKRLTWANRVVVVDCGSDDRTCRIVKDFSNTHLLYRSFDTHRQQWNFATAQAETEWVLCLDADYLVPAELVQEINCIPNNTPRNGFFAHFHYRVLGRVLTRHAYPPKLVLFRGEHATFEQDVDTERVNVDGTSGTLSTSIIHDDRKSLRRYLNNQANYAQVAAKELSSADWSELGYPDRIRRTGILGPPAMLFYCVFMKGLVLNGWPGWYYTLERTAAEVIKAMALIREVRSHGEK